MRGSKKSKRMRRQRHAWGKAQRCSILQAAAQADSPQVRLLLQKLLLLLLIRIGMRKVLNH